MQKKISSREAATDNQRMMASAHAAAVICRPSRAPINWDAYHLGLTPQAMDLSRLRRSIALRFLWVEPACFVLTPGSLA